MPLAVYDPVGQQFSIRTSGIRAGDECMRGAAQRIVDRAERMPTRVPGTKRPASCVIDCPALTCFHARLVDAHAEEVVVVAHDDTAWRGAALHGGIAHRLMVALDVELDPRRVLLVQYRAVPHESVVHYRQERSPEYVDVRDGRRTGMGR